MKERNEWLKNRKIIIWISISIVMMVLLIGRLGKWRQYTPTLQAESVATDQSLSEKVDVLKVENIQESEKKVVSETEKILKSAEKNIAVFGMDEGGYRPDVMLVINLDGDKATVISLPRDTYVVWTPAYQEIAQARGWKIAKSKLNEMLAFGGVENIEQLTMKEIERILDVKIDNYIIVTLDIFKEAVDALGGVEVEVPEGISELSPGRQVLDGTQAETMVRFRGYRDGDLGRIRAQQVLMSAVIEQILRPNNLLKLLELVKVFIDKVDTDMKFEDILPYYNYVKQLKEVDPSFYIVPGVARYQDNRSYFFVDEELTREQVSEWIK